LSFILNSICILIVEEGFMVCKELTDILCDYLEGTLDSDTYEELKEHFNDCPPCTAFLNTYKKTSNLCKQSVGQIEVPPALEAKLKSFIQRKLKKKDQA
jgi:predicted anti-sigma-YlaC factor YlaD